MVHWKAGTGEGNGNDPSSAEFLQVADCWFEVAAGYSSDRDVARSLLTILAQHVELAEPFERIHQAIREAQRLGGPGEAHAYDHAA
jgi:hypothetical protein